MTQSSAPAPAPSSTSRSAQVSDAYSQLVGKIEDEDYDLVGIVAYALYKKSKIEHIVATGKPKHHPDFTDYHQSLTPTDIAALKSVAEAILQAYANQLAQEYAKTAREAAVNSEYLRSVKEQVASLHDHIQRRTSARGAVISGVVASFVFAILLTLIASIQWQNPFLSSVRYILRSVDRGAVEPQAPTPVEAQPSPPAASR